MRPHVPHIIGDLTHRIADLERRIAYQTRKGTVHQIDEDKGLYRVKIGTDSDGAPLLTGWMPNQEQAMGDVRIAVGLSLGEQVDVVSHSGDMSDAEIVSSLQRDRFPRPKVKPGELRIRREKDDVEVFVGPEKILLKVGGIELELTPTGIRIKGDMTQDGVHVDRNGVHG